MIIDKLENRANYLMLHPRVKAALDFLASTDLASLPTGRHNIDGDKLFAIVDEYNTKVPGSSPFESHQRYADVQFIVSGEESFGYIPFANQPILAPYNDQRDYVEYDYESNKADASFIQLKTGMFAIFLPQDLHMPCLGVPPVKVRKVVCKVLISQE